MTVLPAISNNSFGCPIRRECPAAGTIAKTRSGRVTEDTDKDRANQQTGNNGDAVKHEQEKPLMNANPR
jgi:hypothetical protein